MNSIYGLTALLGLLLIGHASADASSRGLLAMHESKQTTQSKNDAVLDPRKVARRLLNHDSRADAPAPWFVTANTEATRTDYEQGFYQTGVDPEIVLNIVNSQRAVHGSPPLIYDDGLAATAFRWANRCIFSHTRNNAGNGENLSVTSSYINALHSWYQSEVCLYDFSQPGYSEATGHFTQIVWASTRRIGCAVGNCPDGITEYPSGRTMGGVLLVCRYGSAGNMNYGSMFEQNVWPFQPGMYNPCIW